MQLVRKLSSTLSVELSTRWLGAPTDQGSTNPEEAYEDLSLLLAHSTRLHDPNADKHEPSLLRVVKIYLNVNGPFADANVSLLADDDKLVMTKGFSSQTDLS